jgi:hypothetical protein
MQQVESDEEKARVCQVANELAKRTMRGSLSAHWWLPLDMVSYTGANEVSEAKDEELLNVSAFPCAKHHRDE